MTLLLLKLLLAPTLVVGSSLAGRRWGPPVAGTLVGLPIVAGPILLISCLERGPAFGEQAAAAALLGLLSLALFTLVLAWACRYLGWLSALLSAWTVCLVASLSLSRVPVPAGVGLPLVLTSAWMIAKLLPRDQTDRKSPPPRWPWWDLPARAAATAVLVIAVTAAAAAIGPNATGVLAPFPIATSVVAAFAIAQHGSIAAVNLLRGIPHGLVGFATFCFLTTSLLKPVGVGLAFGLALTGTLLIQLIWLSITTRWKARAPEL